MDASDYIREKKAKVLFTNQFNIFISQNPSGDCWKLSTCTSTISKCNYHFDTYQASYDFDLGKKACKNCSC